MWATSAIFMLLPKANKHPLCPDGGVAQWTSHQPQRQQTRVRIPLGYKVFRKNIAMLLCVFDLICIVCVLKKKVNLSAQRIIK
jgi:hypothetical protein